MHKLSCLLFIICFAGCTAHVDENAELPGRKGVVAEILADEDSTSVTDENVLTYEGIISADASAGSQMILKLFTHTNTYQLISTRTEAKALSGAFNTERGFEADENATLYVLNDNQPQNKQLYFVRETGKDLLIQLDSKRHRLSNAIHLVKQ